MIADIEIGKRACDPDHAPFMSDLSFFCWDVIQSTCAKFDDFSFNRSRDMIGAHQNFNGSRDLTTHLSGMICHP